MAKRLQPIGCLLPRLSEVRSQYADARETINRLEAAISERDRETEESVHDRDLEKNTLTAKITALEAKAEEGTQAYAQALKVNVSRLYAFSVLFPSTVNGLVQTNTTPHHQHHNFTLRHRHQ
ncbi:unnamed protein product [Dibothriocephalus latus]|uniref:Uncharacterized protein n=1 Tax=Dibothriocephalus latus TaxID=60516 RepID=A0A3P7RC57_DIBLA|nr:unnamed protein product [Dibothriocephalus latus]